MLDRVERQADPDFGKVIFEARQRRNWSLRSAARELGMPHSRLDEVEKGRKWHTGLSARPTMAQVVRMAVVYEIPVESLLAMAGYPALHTLSEEERELLDAFRGLPLPLRARAIEAVKGLRGEP